MTLSFPDPLCRTACREKLAKGVLVKLNEFPMQSGTSARLGIQMFVNSTKVVKYSVKITRKGVVK